MLTASDILSAWELGETQPPVERALTLLSCGFREQPMAELSALSIGQRDELLLSLREQTFGNILRGFAECPQCRGKLRFLARSTELRVSPPSAIDRLPIELIYQDWRLQFRRIDSHDLAIAASYGDIESGRRVLIERCLILAQHGQAEVAADELPDEVLAQLASALAERDPQSEMLLAMSCPGCQHAFTVLFDIAAFLWTEVATQAQRLLDEVDALARAYGWRESDILAMSSARRHLYLKKVGHE